MDPRKLEYYEYEFLDLTDIDENERKHLKHTLFSQGTPDFLQLPWTNHNIVEEEWSKEPPDHYDEAEHVPNGPLDVPGSVSPTMGVPARTTLASVVQHMPAVTMYSQHAPPPYTMPPSTGYQHPQNVFVSNVSNMHTYMAGHYVQPHYAPMPEPPDMAGRGHRGRSRGRGSKRNEPRMDNTIVETSNAPAFNQHQHQQFVPIHAYHPAAAYYPQSVGSHMPHPSAQHATGSPLYITPMYPPPMYSTYPHPSAQYFPPPNAHVTPVMEEQPPEIQEMEELQHQQQVQVQVQVQVQDQQLYPQMVVNEGDPHYIHNEEAPSNNTSTVIVNSNSNMEQNFVSNCNVKSEAEPEIEPGHGHEREREREPDDTNNMYSVNNVISAEVHDFNENVNVTPELPVIVSCVVAENIKTEPVVTVIKTDPIFITNKTNVEITEPIIKKVAPVAAPPAATAAPIENISCVNVTVPTKIVTQKSVQVQEKPSVNVNVNNNVHVNVKQDVIVDSDIKPQPSPAPPPHQQQQQQSVIVQELSSPIISPEIKEEQTFTSCEPEQTHQFDLLPVQSSGGKSWASLFNKGGGGGGGSVSVPAAVNTSTPPLNSNNTRNVSHSHIKAQSLNSSYPKIYDEKQTEKTANNEYANIKNHRGISQMGEFISKYALDFRTVSLQPRGLTNRSNYCYINSILQALLACPPLYNLLVALPHHRPRRKTNVKSTTPILDAMIDFVNEFTPLSADARLNRKEKGQRKDNIDIICGTSFEPSGIYKILNGIRTDTFIVEGRQEDAEEFFGCILNGLNDEMLELTKQFEENKHENLSNGDIATNGETHDQDEVEWTVMGPKNKGSITRRAEFGRTPVSDIFRGQLRSRVHRMGDQITDNVQPFFTLQLDIEKPNTVYDALEQLVNKDKLEGVTCWKTNKQVEAWQQVTIEELPAVLVLHLKCFNYKLDACSKIIKALDFPIDLKIDSKLLSIKAKYTAKQKQYKLFAVVYHDGKEASKGHYLTDAYHVGYGGWVRYDDSTVKSVQESQVLHPGGARVPYLLYYRRSDTIGNQNQQNVKKD